MADNRTLRFTWTPGHGPDAEALKRMTDLFVQPTAPMGEAWFIGEVRQFYPELLGDLRELSDEQLIQSLVEIANGVPCFGPLKEWTDWYHYLLPRLIGREWKPVLYHPVELLLTGFFSQHPDRADASPYARFNDDAILALGKYIMSPDFWSITHDEVPKFFCKWEGPSGLNNWDQVDGLLSGSLFYCLKYLPSEAIETWFRSVIAIPNPYWRVQLVTWLVGAHSILTNQISQPAQFSDKLHFAVGWEWSHALSGNYSGDHGASPAIPPFVPERAREAVIQIALEIEPEWLTEIFTDPRLAQVLAMLPDLPERFEQLYRQ